MVRKEGERGELGKITDIDQVVLAGTYFGVRRFPHRMRSPLREDKSPGCTLYLKGDRVYFKDFATGENYGILDLLMRMFGLDIKGLHKRILEDMNSGRLVAREEARVIRSSAKADFVLRVTARGWEQRDTDYWEMYGVNHIMLRGFGVEAISEVIYDYPTMRKTFKADDLAYVFHEYKDGEETIKVYQPYSKTMKWRNNHNSSVIQLWSHIPETGPVLFICSSLKDALCLWSNTGYPAIAPQSETTMIKPKIVAELEKRFESIYVCYDTDNAGRCNEKRVCEGSAMVPFNMPEFAGGKDLSDYFKRFGKRQFMTMVFNRLSELGDGV